MIEPKLVVRSARLAATRVAHVRYGTSSDLSRRIVGRYCVVKPRSVGATIPVARKQSPKSKEWRWSSRAEWNPAKLSSQFPIAHDLCQLRKENRQRNHTLPAYAIRPQETAVETLRTQDPLLLDLTFS